MLANFGWVIPGRLAGMGRPRPGQAEEIRSHGIGAVLSLTETPPPEEFTEAGPREIFVHPSDLEAARELLAADSPVDN